MRVSEEPVCRDRKRKAETSMDMLGHWAGRAYTVVPGRDRQRKSDAFKDMLGQAVPYSAWQGQLQKNKDKGRDKLGWAGHLVTA
jgi:hypothetical protein